MTTQANWPDSRLTVIEVGWLWYEGRRFTEIEAWYWAADDDRLRRYKLVVEGELLVGFGDLVRRDPSRCDFLVAWTNKEKRIPGRWPIAKGFVALAD